MKQYIRTLILRASAKAINDSQRSYITSIQYMIDNLPDDSSVLLDKINMLENFIKTGNLEV